MSRNPNNLVLSWTLRALTVLLLSWLGVWPALAGNAWSAVGAPLPGPPQVIGSHAAGCIAGAVALPLIGTGYQVMRPSRNRYYGHPRLIRFVERLGQQTAAQGAQLLIGDLGQPRGGPMPSGHRSHQSGLDVDVWFLQQPRDRRLTRADTERIEMLSMIQPAAGVLQRSRWSPRYRDALRAAALAPEVERIFVNPIIKQALCVTESNPDWLEKVRPWWGHDAHFHVRLACPPNDSQCKPQKPFPPGDGCDPELAKWVDEIVQATLYPKPRPKPEPPSAQRLPVACDAVLYSATAWSTPDFSDAPSMEKNESPMGKSAFSLERNESP